MGSGVIWDSVLCIWRESTGRAAVVHSIIPPTSNFLARLDSALPKSCAIASLPATSSMPSTHPARALPDDRAACWGGGEVRPVTARFPQRRGNADDGSSAACGQSRVSPPATCGRRARMSASLNFTIALSGCASRLADNARRFVPVAFPRHRHREIGERAADEVRRNSVRQRMREGFSTDCRASGQW